MQRAWGDERPEHEGPRRSEAVLRSAEAAEGPLLLERAVLDHLPDAVLVHRAGVVVFANATAARLLGYEDDELLGLDYRDLVHADQRGDATEGAQRPLARCEAPASAPLVLRKKGGAPVRVEGLALPLETEGEREWIVIAREAPTPKGDEVLCAEHVAGLATLAAGVAHEINNPMTYLLVHLEHVTRRMRALVAGARNGEIEDASVESFTGFIDSLAQALEGARKVRHTVRQLMTFAQGATDARAIVDVRSVLESALQMAWHTIRPRARIVKHLGEVPPVEANEARLAQAFIALLTKAAVAIPEGDAQANEVRVATYTDDAGCVVVEVSDTGEGLEPGDLRRVFDPYFATQTPGEGLGLAVAHGTVRSLGGAIACESARGKGTTFRVTLPPAAGWAGRARTRDRRRIAVIDEDPQVGQALALALAAECDVVVLTRAEDALDRLRAGDRFDAIVCDLGMPPPSGIDLYAQALRIAPDAVGRIVFTSNGALTPRARAFLGSVRNVCLDKPIDDKELRSLLRRLNGDGLATRSPF